MEVKRESWLFSLVPAVSVFLSPQGVNLYTPVLWQIHMDFFRPCC